MKLTFSKTTTLREYRVKGYRYAVVEYRETLPESFIGKKAYIEGVIYIDEEPKREEQSCKCPDLSEVETILIDVLTVFESLTVKDRRLSKKITELRSRIEELLRRLR